MSKNLIAIALLFLGLASFTYALGSSIDVVSHIVEIAAG